MSVFAPYIKTDEEIEKMRVAGKIAAQVFDFITPHVEKGVSTLHLDKLCHDYMDELGVYPAPLTKGFPKATCTSPNHVVCHGIPSDKVLKDGDILNIDISLEKDGYFADTAKMFFVGKPKVIAERLVKTTQECLYEAISIVKPGTTLRDIGRTIEGIASKNRFSVVHEFCGHGVGKELHEGKYHVLHYDSKAQEEYVLEPGVTFTIEPMINAGKRYVKVLPDGWTVVTKDRSLSAQWEHTLVVTETGVDVLTKRDEESF